MSTANLIAHNGIPVVQTQHLYTCALPDDEPDEWNQVVEGHQLDMSQATLLTVLLFAPYPQPLSGPQARSNESPGHVTNYFP